MKAKKGSERLVLGSRFGMAMKVGIPYSMVSDRRGARRAPAHRLADPWPRPPRLGGRIWRYELEPVEGGTLVRESWDITHESVLSKWMVGPGRPAAEGMTATLERIEELLTSGDDDATA